jgi:mitochondrial fission protein ELM1
LQRNAAALTHAASGRKCRAMKTARILCTDIAGLRAQALGLAEAAGFAPDLRVLSPRGVWRHVSPALWIKPLSAVEEIAIETPLPELVIGCGGRALRWLRFSIRAWRWINSTWCWRRGMTGLAALT